MNQRIRYNPTSALCVCFMSELSSAESSALIREGLYGDVVLNTWEKGIMRFYSDDRFASDRGYI